MVKFPVLFHGYSLVNFPRERAAIQIQKFGKPEYVRWHSNALSYHSPLQLKRPCLNSRNPFVRTVKQGTLLRLINISRRYNAVVLTELATSIAK